MHKRSLEDWEIKEALCSGRYLALALVDKVRLGGAGACVWAPDAASAYGEPAYVGARPMWEHTITQMHLWAMLGKPMGWGLDCFLPPAYTQLEDSLVAKVALKSWVLELAGC